MARSSLACTEKNRLHSINTGTEKDRRKKPAVFSMEGALKQSFLNSVECRPQGGLPSAAPRGRGPFGGEEIPVPP